MEEKMYRIELTLEVLQKEVKGAKSALFSNYKKILKDKKEKTKEDKEVLKRALAEIEELKGKIIAFQYDAHFFTQENKRQREIIREIADENEFGGKNFSSVNKTRNSDLFIFEKDEFYSEMMEKIIESCEHCEGLKEELKKKVKTFEDLQNKINRLKHENRKLLEDNRSLEVITERMQEFLMSSSSKSVGLNIENSVCTPMAGLRKFKLNWNKKYENRVKNGLCLNCSKLGTN